MNKKDMTRVTYRPLGHRESALLAIETKFHLGEDSGQGFTQISMLAVVIVLKFFLHAPHLFVWLKETPKHILCSLQTPYVTSFQSY